jgi:hypothetical protein
MQVGKDTKHFENERDSLLVQMRAHTLNSTWLAQVLELAATNAALWDAEDDLRGYRLDDQGGVVSKEACWEDAAKLAFRIQALNDQRTQIIASINKQTGENFGPEKL